MPNSEWISCNALPSTSKVCGPFICLHASATEHLFRVLGSSQWAVTPKKLLRLVLQQSVVVAMTLTVDIASIMFLFMSSAASSILLRNVVLDIREALG